MTLTLKRCLHIIVLFSYLNAILDHAYGGATYKDADTYFEVENIISNVFSLKVYEKGTLSADVWLLPGESAVERSTSFTTRRKDNGYKVHYRGNDDCQLKFLISDQGDITLKDKKTNTGLRQQKTWGIKTEKSISHHGILSFHGLYTDSQAFLNYGILHLDHHSFSFNYLFNSGAILGGELEKFQDLDQYQGYINKEAKPSFQNGVSDNHGLRISAGSPLSLTNHTFRNHGLAIISQLHLDKSTRLEIHSPAIIKAIKIEKGGKLINYSHLKLNKILSPIEKEQLINEGILITGNGNNFTPDKNLVIPGIVINKSGLKDAFRTSFYPLQSEKNGNHFYKKLKEMAGPADLPKDLRQLLVTDIQKELYRHNTNFILGRAISSWHQTGIESQDIVRRFYNPQLQKLLKKIALSKQIPTIIPKEAATGQTLDETLLSECMMRAQSEKTNLFAWIKAHERAFLHVLNELFNPWRAIASFFPVSDRNFFGNKKTLNSNQDLQDDLTIHLFHETNLPGITTFSGRITRSGYKPEEFSPPQNGDSYTHILKGLCKFKVLKDGTLLIRGLPTMQTNRVALRIKTPGALLLRDMQLDQLEAEAKTISFGHKFKARQVMLKALDPNPSALLGRVRKNTVFKVDKLCVQGGYFINSGTIQSSGILKLLLMGGIFENNHLMKSQKGLRMAGTSLLINTHTIQAPEIHSRLYFLWNGGFINSKNLMQDAWAFINSGETQIVDQAGFQGYRFDGSFGKYHMGSKAEIATTHFDNNEGSISGAVGTKVTIEKSFANKQGQLGAGGLTNLTFKTVPMVEELGTLLGDSVLIDDQSRSPLSRLNNGVVAGKMKASIYAHTPDLGGVDFQTPRLILWTYGFLLSDQTRCAQTIVRRTATQDFLLRHPYRTAGTFEIRDASLASETGAEKAMESRFGDGTGSLPKPTHKIDIQATVQADQGMKVFAPAAEFHVGSEKENVSPELLLQNSFLQVYASAFDLEKGALAAIRAMLWAPLGHTIGRLIKDPNRDLVATFYSHGQCPTSHNLGNCIASVRYHFLDQVLTNVYDGRHLLIMTVAVSNNTFVRIKELTSFKGPLKHYGDLETGNCALDSPQDCEMVASIFNVRQNFEMKGSGNIHLKRYLANPTFTYYTFAGGWIAHSMDTYRFAGSDPADFKVHGNIDSIKDITIFNTASNLYGFQKSPTITIQKEDFTSKLYQKFIGGTLEERQSIYKTKLDPVKMGDYRRKGIRITNANASHYWEQGCHFWAGSFLYLTNNFEGAQNHFPANTSFASGVVMPANQTRIEGNLSAPLVLIPVGKGGLVLGSPNPYTVNRQEPIRDLMAKGFNLHTTYVSEGLRKLIDEATKPRFHFMFRERFWFDDNQAQNFYETLKDDVIIFTPEKTFRRANLNSIFSLSPQLLVDRIRQDCQDVLKRGYLYDKRPIDEALVQELHRNTSEYLKTTKLSGEDLEKALMVADDRIPAPSKPMIFYRAFMNEQGLEELKPCLYIPPAMIDEAHGKKGSKIRADKLYVVPEGLTPLQMLAYFRNQPLIQEQLIEAFDSNPKAVTYLTRQARAIQAQRNQDAAEPLPLAAFNSNATVELNGEFDTRTSVIMADGNMVSHADIQGVDVLLASLFGNAIFESRSERVGLGNWQSFYDRIAVQVRANAKNRLSTFSGQATFFKKAETASGLRTYFKALGDIYDIPLPLLEQRVTYHTGDYTGTETWRSVYQATSTHGSKGEFIQEADGKMHLAAPTYYGKSGGIRAKGKIEAPEVHDIRQYESNLHKEGSGLFGKSKTIQESWQSSTSKGIKLHFDEPYTLRSSTADVKLTNPTMTGAKATIHSPGGPAVIGLGTNSYTSRSSSSSSSSLWNSSETRSESHRTYTVPNIQVPLEIHSDETILETIRGQTLDYIHRVQQHGGPIVQRVLEEYHHSESNSVEGPGVALSALITLAVGVATQGMGASLAAGMFEVASHTAAAAMWNAGVTAALSQTALSMVSHQGNMDKVFADLTSPRALKSIATSIATAGITRGLAAELKLPTDSSVLSDQINYAALQSGIKMAFNLTVEKQGLDQALKNFIVDTAGHVLARQIGVAYKPKDGSAPLLDPVMHKAAHAAVGAVTGAIVSKDPAQGAIAGAMGAALSEIIAEGLSQNIETLVQDIEEEALREEKPLSIKEFEFRLEQKLHTHAGLGKLGAAVTALLSGQDVNVAIQTATNAVDNNFASAIPLLIEAALVTFLRTPQGQALLLATGMTMAQYMQSVQEKHGPMKMDEAPEDAKSSDKGFTPEQSKATINSTPQETSGAKVHSTPVAETRPQVNSTPVYDGPSGSVLYKAQLPDHIPEGTWLPPQEALDRVPDFLGMGQVNNKGAGWKWVGRHGANQVRIDKGDPTQDYPHQQVDHVRINVNGQMMGVDGQLLPTTATRKDPLAHIPLSEWLNWKAWDQK